MIDEWEVSQLQQHMTGRERAYLEALLSDEFISLSQYIQAAWPVVEPATDFISNWHIDAISDHLEAVTWGWIKNLIINIPPRHMKSLTVSVFWPTWAWTWRPELRWLFASYAEKLAIRDNVKSRRVIKSPWYQARWGHVFRLTGDQNEKMRFENDRSGYRIATSVGGSATGEGGDIIVVDDPHKMKEVESDLIREGVLDWWDETMSTRLNDPKSGNKVILMQRGHEQDLTGHVLEKMEQGGESYEHLCLPAEYEPTTYVTAIGFEDPRTEPGELLWPDHFDQEAIDNLKISLGSRASAAQLQQRPSPAEGDIFKKKWWRFWIPPGSNLPPYRIKLPDGSLFECEQRELPAFFTEQLQSWDMAFKDTKSSAFVAGQVWARLGADKFLLDQERDRWDFPATLAAVRRVTTRHPAAHAKLVEDKANGPAVIQTLRSSVAGLIAVNPEGDKVSRANAVTPDIEAGNVYLPHPAIAPWVDGLIDECASFPNGAFSDQVDTLSQGLVRLKKNEQRDQKSRPRSHSL
jgi:predicted phage terminase large subunit-like protein